MARFVQLLRGVFEWEVLPPAPERAPCPPRRGLLSLLFSPELLPFERAPVPVRGHGLLALLFALERLPRDPERPPARARARWLRWLFAPESMDPQPPEVD